MYMKKSIFLHISQYVKQSVSWWITVCVSVSELMLSPLFQECFDCSHMNCNLEYGITTEDYNKTKSLMQQPKQKEINK